MNSFPFIIYNINMKTLYKSLLVLTILTLIFRTLTFFQYSLFISIALLLVVHWIPHILYKTEYVAYIYLTQVLGTTCGFYNLPYYDKFMHFLSRAIFVIIAYIILKKYIKEKPLLMIMMNCVETAIAFLWEVFEYSGLLLFNYDASRHYTTGVHDTMQDMIFSFIAGLIITYIIYKYPSYIDSLYKLPPDNLELSSQQSHI